jgi:hypothetical protein
LHGKFLRETIEVPPASRASLGDLIRERKAAHAAIRRNPRE